MGQHTFWMLWSAYLLHCYGDHRFCIDENVGLASIGKSTCAVQKSPVKLFNNQEGEILRSYLFNDRIAVEVLYFAPPILIPVKVPPFDTAYYSIYSA